MLLGKEKKYIMITSKRRTHPAVTNVGIIYF